MPSKILKRAILSVVGMLIILYSAFPIYWMVISSVRPPDSLLTEVTLVPTRFTFEYYRNLMELTDYPAYFVNSVIVAEQLHFFVEGRTYFVTLRHFSNCD